MGWTRLSFQRRDNSFCCLVQKGRDNSVFFLVLGQQKWDESPDPPVSILFICHQHTVAARAEVAPTAACSRARTGLESLPSGERPLHKPLVQP